MFESASNDPGNVLRGPLVYVDVGLDVRECVERSKGRWNKTSAISENRDGTWGRIFMDGFNVSDERIPEVYFGTY